MTTFTLEPFVGPLPVRFEMTPEEVQALLGPPEKVHWDMHGDRSETRKSANLGFSKATGRLNEVVVLPESQLLFNGVDLYSLADPIAFLRQFDPIPQFAVGFVFFLKLGIAMTGFNDGNEDEKSIHVTPAHYYDEWKGQFVPYR